jgi:hypothetical protein
MKSFVKRLKKEEEELVKKTTKLIEFTLTSDYEELSDGNKYLLEKQLDIMSDYINILTTRIELNK